SIHCIPLICRLCTISTFCLCVSPSVYLLFSLHLYLLTLFFFNDPAPTEIYTLSLHDALPISAWPPQVPRLPAVVSLAGADSLAGDRKSTRLNSSHGSISYAVFCLKKKKKNKHICKIIRYGRVNTQ